MRYPTIKEVGDAAAISVGLVPASSYTASSDPAIIQLLQCIKEAGEDLLDMHRWQQHIRAQEISVSATTPGASEEGYDLPCDFGRLLPDTVVDLTNQLPTVGPVNPGDWSRLMSDIVATVTATYWRIFQDRFYVAYPPETVRVIRLEYVTRAWVMTPTDAAAPTGTVGYFEATEITDDRDLLLFDKRMLVLKAKASWYAAKGFDTSAVDRDFLARFEEIKGAHEGGQPIYLGSRYRSDRLIDWRNVPETGFGY